MNGQVTSKKEHHHHTLAVSMPRMGQMEVRQTGSTQFSAVRLPVNQEPSVTYWNLRRTVPTIRPKAQTVWTVLALPDIVPTRTYCCLKHGSRESWNVHRVKKFENGIFINLIITLSEKRDPACAFLMLQELYHHCRKTYSYFQVLFVFSNAEVSFGWHHVLSLFIFWTPPL